MCIQITLDGKTKNFNNRLETISFLSSSKKNSFSNSYDAIQQVEDCIAGKITLPSVKNVVELHRAILNIR